MANPEKSNGYEDVAAEFIAGRGRNSSGVGASVVADWSKTLPCGATVLDLGCGTGVANFAGFDRARVQGVRSGRLTNDPGSVPSPFPSVPVECAAAEDSDFFARSFDGVVAWGLFILLDPEVQRRLIKKVAGLLESRGPLAGA